MSKIIIENKVIEGIPVNEYYLEQDTFIGLVFVQHGYQSNKNRGADVIALNLARQGFKAISIDAYKHGERIEEPFITMKEYKRFASVFNVVTRTAKDIIYLYDLCYRNEFSNFSFVGVSMGGMIAFYLSTITEKIDKLVPVIGTPSFLEMTQHVVNLDDPEKYKHIVKNNLDFINEIDPIQHVDKMSYNKMFILNTTKDEVVPGTFSEKFYETYKNDKMMFKYYEDYHNVNKEMTNDILTFLCEKKITI